MKEAPPSPFAKFKRFLVGAPIASREAHHEKLSPAVGLAVFASDSLSSVAYATEAILAVLVLISVSALGLQLPISLSIVALIAIIAFSYRQTIKAYPQGGGSYVVTSDNLGPKAGVVAGAALMIDYILTVAVSVAAGVAAIASAFPAMHSFLVPMSVFFIIVLGWANLRGLKESGAVFSIPTYGFVVVMYIMLGFAIYKISGLTPAPQKILAEPGKIGSEANYPLMFVILRAFAAGCTALTGIEAVSDGTQAFQKPEQKNASNTLVRMAIILSTLFLGMGYVISHMPEIALYSAKNPQFRTVASQVAAFSFGGDQSFGYYAVQAFTALILLLAANTAFADFPRVCSFLARDGFMPRYMSRLGDRLVFHNGIIALSVAAIGLVIAFKGELEQLLPLYAVGVFTAFSLSQAGMVAHWLKLRTGSWRSSIAINGTGLVLCIIVLLIILVTKFMEGAWVIAILLPLLCGVMLSIRNHYTRSAEKQKFTLADTDPYKEHIALLLVPRVHRGIVNALDYARNLKGDIKAVHVTLNEKKLPELQRNWELVSQDIPLVILASPYRSLLEPVLDYVDELIAEHPEMVITVIVSDADSNKWYHDLLSENVALQLRNALSKRSNVVVANIRHQVDAE